MVWLTQPYPIPRIYNEHLYYSRGNLNVGDFVESSIGLIFHRGRAMTVGSAIVLCLIEKFPRSILYVAARVSPSPRFSLRSIRKANPEACRRSKHSPHPIVIIASAYTSWRLMAIARTNGQIMPPGATSEERSGADAFKLAGTNEQTERAPDGMGAKEGEGEKGWRKGASDASFWSVRIMKSDHRGPEENRVVIL